MSQTVTDLAEKPSAPWDARRNGKRGAGLKSDIASARGKKLMRVRMLALIIGLSGGFPGSAFAVEASLTTGSINRSATRNASGIWITTGGKSMVEIAPCQSGLCSQIVWLRQPYDSRGRLLRDRRNQNPSMRNRTIIGLPVLHALRPAGDGSWGGRVYNPESGKTYKVNVYLRSATRLEVRGCASIGWPCRSSFWRRAVEIDAPAETSVSAKP